MGKRIAVIAALVAAVAVTATSVPASSAGLVWRPDYAHVWELEAGRNKAALMGSDEFTNEPAGTWTFDITTSADATKTFVQLYRQPCYRKDSQVDSTWYAGGTTNATHTVETGAGSYCVRIVHWGAPGSTATIKFNSPSDAAEPPFEVVI